MFLTETVTMSVTNCSFLLLVLDYTRTVVRYPSCWVPGTLLFCGVGKALRGCIAPFLSLLAGQKECQIWV